MNVIRQDLKQFVLASENLLRYEVKLEGLTATEMEIINYYLIAMVKKFATVEDYEVEDYEKLGEPVGTA